MPDTQRMNFDSQRINFDNRRSESGLFHRYSKRPRHVVEKRYRLLDFPNNFKFIERKKSTACAHVDEPKIEPSFSIPSEDGLPSFINGFSRELY